MIISSGSPSSGPWTSTSMRTPLALSCISASVISRFAWRSTTRDTRP
jgi:hypothetical protein